MAIGDANYVVELREENARLRAEVERLQADRETAVVQAESDYQHEIDQLRAEVERLRLTDADRAALDNAAQWLVAIQSADDPRAGECAATLRGVLARHGGER